MNTIEKYKGQFQRYHGRIVRNVKIEMHYSYTTFFPTWLDMIRVLHDYHYPCLWLASELFLTPFGKAGCCNDHEMKEPYGDIFASSLKELIGLKKRKLPESICKGCNQTPARMMEYGYFYWLHRIADTKWRRKARMAARLLLEK